MVMLSGLLHTVLLLALVSAAGPSQPQSRTPQSYTVSLVAPAALGTAPEPPPAPRPKKGEPAAAAPLPQPQPPPKAEAQKPKTESKEPKRAQAEKKPEAAQPQKKKSVNIASKKVSPPKKPSREKKKPPEKAAVKKAPAKKSEQAKKPLPSAPPKEPAAQDLGAEDREQQIVAALDKVRRRVQAGPPQTTPSPYPPSASGGSGGGNTLRGLPFILYTQQVKQRVKQSWIVAETKSGLTALVRFGILATGEVVGVELVERSGDIVFDESAMRAVRKASPLPPPPEAYRNEFTQQKIEIVFGETQYGQSQ